MTNRVINNLFSFLYLCLLMQFGWAVPQAEPWEIWEKNDSLSEIIVDHALYRHFLETYLIIDESTPNSKGVNRVYYAGVSETDKASLNRYISNMETIEVSRLNRNEQMAYWINLYNALTIKVILDHYPVSSIREIGFPVASSGPWDKKLITIQEVKISLNDIEHRILRPLWKDPRIHFAVNCASYGCPNLQPVPFTRDNLEFLLNKGTFDYINHERGVLVKGNELVLSSIFDWYYSDFAQTKKGVIAFLISFADKDLAEKLRNYKGSIRYAYDWSLNEINKI